MALPPFQTLLDSHGRDIHRFLIANVGPVDADDCWQETWLSALRAYPSLKDASNLRAWVFTIATRVALDDLRQKSRVAELPAELPAENGAEAARPAYEELEHLTGGLPPTERAAVVLRYGYDLPYAEIGGALGSSEEAARAAASSGVRRLRRTLERDT